MRSSPPRHARRRATRAITGAGGWGRVWRVKSEGGRATDSKSRRNVAWRFWRMGPVWMAISVAAHRMPFPFCDVAPRLISCSNANACLCSFLPSSGNSSRTHLHGTGKPRRSFNAHPAAIYLPSSLHLDLLCVTPKATPSVAVVAGSPSLMLRRCHGVRLPCLRSANGCRPSA